MIVYCDGTEYEGPPESAPDKDVLFIVGEPLVQGGSWYVFVYEGWRAEYCKDEADRHRAEGHPVLHGGWVPDETWKAQWKKYF